MPLAEDHGASRFSPCFFSPYHECFLIDPPEEVEKDGNDNDDVKELSEKAKERLERAQPLFLLSCYFRTYGSSCEEDIEEKFKPSPGEWVFSERREPLLTIYIYISWFLSCSHLYAQVQQNREKASY